MNTTSNPQKAALSTALAALYTTFSGNQLLQPPDACPCCITDTENMALFSVPLHCLTQEQLRRYAFKSITTWGSASDFQYFLPRLLELSLEPQSDIEKETLFNKLELAGWTSWPDKEQQAVRHVLLAWWEHHIQYECFFESEVIALLVRLQRSIIPLLRAWQPAAQGGAFENLVRTIPWLDHIESQILTSNPDIGISNVAELRRWVKQQLPVLEEGFFREEMHNDELAQAISLAHILATNLKAD